MGIDGSSLKKKNNKNGKQYPDDRATANLSNSSIYLPSLSDILTLKSVKYIFGIVVILLVGFVLLPLYRAIFLGMSDDMEVSHFEKKAETRAENVSSELESLEIHDPGLASCITKEATEMANIHPGSTGGIDHFNQLSRLTCMDASISTITGISELSELTYINLDYNSISDIYELIHLPKLQHLSLIDNPVSNIVVVQEMQSLKKIILPDLPNNYCFEIKKIVSEIESNFDTIQCKGKWSLALIEINDRKSKRLPLTSEQETILEEFEYNQTFMSN